MGLFSGLKTAFNTVVQAGKSAVRAVVNGVKEFVEDACERIMFGTDRGYDHPEETDRMLVSECHEAVEEVLGLSPFSQFATLRPEERQIAVVQITSQVADAMGVKLDSIDIEEQDGTYGFYSFSENRISIDENHVCEDPMTEIDAKNVIDTIVHEVRHAYQHRAARHPTRYKRDKLTASTWRLNFRNYVSPRQNLELYYRQPVEEDARKFAEYVVNSFQ